MPLSPTSNNRLGPCCAGETQCHRVLLGQNNHVILAGQRHSVLLRRGPAAPAMRGAGTPRSGGRRVMLTEDCVAGRLLLLGRRGAAGEAGGNIEQPLAQGLADAGKNLRGDLAEPLFGGGGQSADYIL